jgi:hypothetical protein
LYLARRILASELANRNTNVRISSSYSGAGTNNPFTFRAITVLTRPFRRTR